MKRFFYHPITVTAIVVVLIILLGNFKAKDRFLSDDELREYALATSYKPVPKSYDELLKVVDNPNNRLSREKIALGKRLFFENLLSKDKSINCASCHILEQGGDDNIPTAIGYHGRKNPFHLNSPTVLNSALATAQFWDGRAKDVEEQAGGPMQAPFEMNITPKEAEERINAIASYKEAFKKVFGSSKITFENIRNAIGAYERTLLTRGAFDRFLEGDNSAISAKAKRGMNLFLTRGCKGCHSGMAVGGGSMQHFPLRHYLLDYLGIELNPTLTIKGNPYPISDLGGFRGKNSDLLFRVPILRNVTKTAPYFHNGSVDKLEEAVRIMSKYQLGREFSKYEISDVVEFLKTLEGEVVGY